MLGGRGGSLEAEQFSMLAKMGGTALSEFLRGGGGGGGGGVWGGGGGVGVGGCVGRWG